MPDLRKNETAPLNVTQRSRHRVFVGLGWNPHDKPGLLDKAKAIAGRKVLHHDLDLSCYLFDADKGYIGQVCADADRHSDESGQIYHSGDNVEGIGEGDDEQISVELKGLTHKIHSIVFVASVKNGHVFEEINSPEIRIVDGYSGHDFLSQPLNDAEGAHKTDFVFVRIYADKPDTWRLHYIGGYASFGDEGDVARTLGCYL